MLLDLSPEFLSSEVDQSVEWLSFSSPTTIVVLNVSIGETDAPAAEVPCLWSLGLVKGRGGRNLPFSLEGGGLLEGIVPLSPVFAWVFELEEEDDEEEAVEGTGSASLECEAAADEPTGAGEKKGQAYVESLFTGKRWCDSVWWSYGA